ncbi:hypothetical protein D9M71_503990 [compost metagenome]
MLERFGKHLGLALGHQHIVGGNADLSGVEAFAMGNAQGRILKVGIGTEKRRRLTAQLQGHWHQMLGCGAHYLTPDLRRAGEYQVIKRQASECLGAGHLAAEHCHLVFVEYLGEHLLQHLTAVWRIFRHFDHCPVAGRQGCHQRAQGQVQREVPGADDAHHTLGLVLDPGLVAEKQQFGLAPLGFHPAPQMGDGVACLQYGAEHFDLAGFECRAAAEIGFKGGDNALLITAQHGDQAFEVVQSTAQRGVRLNVEGLALTLQQQLHALDFLGVESV